MTDQSISAALRMNNGARVASGGGKGHFSGQNSRQDGMVQDADDGEFSEATAATSNKSSRDGNKTSQSGDAPDFDEYLQSVKSKKDAKATAQAAMPEGDADSNAQPDAANQNGKAASATPDEVLAKLIKSLNSPEAQTGNNQTQAAQSMLQEAQLQTQLGGQGGSAGTGQATGSAKEQMATKPGADFLLDQKAGNGQMPGTAANGEIATGKTGLFDAYAVDTKSVSAFDKIVPVVKEAVLTPSQKALRDGFTVLRQETHFAPTATVDTSGVATTNAVFQQIGTAIANDLAPSSSAKSASSSSASTAQQSTTGGFRVANGGDALRVLDIQLHPADLGKVRLSIRVNDTSVDVRVEVTNAATAKVLEGNKQLLDQLLSKAGYRADHISIVAIDEKSGAQITPPSQNNNAQSQTGQQGQSGAFNGESGDAQQGKGDQQQGSGHGDDAPGMTTETSQFASDEVHNGQDSANHSNGITL